MKCRKPIEVNLFKHEAFKLESSQTHLKGFNEFPRSFNLINSYYLVWKKFDKSGRIKQKHEKDFDIKICLFSGQSFYPYKWRKFLRLSWNNFKFCGKYHVNYLRKIGFKLWTVERPCCHIASVWGPKINKISFPC